MILWELLGTYEMHPRTVYPWHERGKQSPSSPCSPLVKDGSMDVDFPVLLGCVSADWVPPGVLSHILREAQDRRRDGPKVRCCPVIPVQSWPKPLGNWLQWLEGEVGLRELKWCTGGVRQRPPLASLIFACAFDEV